MFVVELWPGCWLTRGRNAPGRTMQSKYAQIYETERGAKIALGMARKYRVMREARVLPVRRWEIRIPCINDDVEIVLAETRGRAKSQIFRSIELHFPGLKYTDVKARLASSGGV